MGNKVFTLNTFSRSGKRCYTIPVASKSSRYFWMFLFGHRHGKQELLQVHFGAVINLDDSYVRVGLNR